MEYNAFFTEVLKISPQIRFAGIYNSNFEKIVDGYQQGIIPLLNRNEYQNSMRFDIRRWETYKMFHGQLGESKYAMVKYAKATLLTFVLEGEKFLRVSINPDTDFKMLIEGVQELINKNPILK